MATFTTAFSLTQTTDALFRVWGSGFAAAWAALGWVQTGDTGQINWLTVTRPLAANTKMGYEIWRFNDALQATSPVFVRIDYGSGSATNNPRMWLTWGTGTDGAGNMNPGSLETFTIGRAGSDTTVRTAYFSGGTGRGCFFTGLNVAASVGCFGFGVERTKDAAGADTGDGLLLIYGEGVPSTATTWRQQYYQLGIGSQGTETTLGALMPTVGSGVTGGDTAIYPLWFGKGPFLPYGMNFFAFFSADITAMVTISLTVYGGGHTYLPLPSILNGIISGGVTGSSLLMRYE